MRPFCGLCLILTLVPFPGAVWGDTQATDEVGIDKGTRICLQLNDYLSTKLNNEGDWFTASVTEAVYLNERLVLPKGSIVTGSISRIIRPGRFRGKAVMNLLFQSIKLPGGKPIPIVASLARVDPEGNAGTGDEGAVKGEGSIGKDAGRVAKPGLAATGIGALIGGAKGAAVGAGVGAAVGLATVFATRGKDLEMRRGSTLDITLDRSLQIPVADLAPNPR